MPGMYNPMGGAANTASFQSAAVSSNTSAPTTNSAIFGPQPDPGTGAPDGGLGAVIGALNPLKAFGLTFWSGIIAVGLLVLIRHSLPA